MKIPYVNCARCGELIVGPFEPPHKMPADDCPKCGKVIFMTPSDPDFNIGGTVTQLADGMSIEMTSDGVGDLGDWKPEQVKQLEGMVEELLGELEKAAAGKPDTVGLVEKLRSSYTMAKGAMPRPLAELAVVAAVQQVLRELELSENDDGQKGPRRLN